MEDKIFPKHPSGISKTYKKNNFFKTFHIFAVLGIKKIFS
jgi:hypothetical protein